MIAIRAEIDAFALANGRRPRLMIEAIGEGITRLRVGQSVAVWGGGVNGYAEYAVAESQSHS